jgi:hypothetical protein
LSTSSRKEKSTSKSPGTEVVGGLQSIVILKGSGIRQTSVSDGITFTFLGQLLII